eukprot:COSAG06_NODE_33792_length_484_cov_0.667532_1_plen_27_part_01
MPARSQITLGVVAVLVCLVLRDISKER